MSPRVGCTYDDPDYDGPQSVVAPEVWDQADLGPALTSDEIRAVTAAGELWNLLCKVVEDGPTREADLRELIVHVHAIQQAVLSNAAGRVYPELFRRLGTTLRADGLGRTL